MIGPRFPILLSQQEFSPYRLPGLEAAYDFMDSAQLKVDASNRVSFAADKSGNSAVMGLVLPGSSGNYASTPNAAPLQITGSMEIRIWVALDDWTPASTTTFVAKRAAAQDAYAVQVQNGSTGRIKFVWFKSASANTATSTAAPTIADGAALWLKVTYLANNGSGGSDVTFYTSPDGVTWTQLGAVVTVAANQSIDSTTAALNVGGDPVNSEWTAGRLHRVQIYNGIAGTLAFDANFSLQTRGAASFTESSANAATVTINTSGDVGARICGARDLAMLTGSKQPLLLPWSGQNYGYLPGVNGNYFSTPDSGATSITGTLEIVVRLTTPDWTPSSVFDIITKFNGSGNQRTFRLVLLTDGKIDLVVSTNGINALDSISSASIPAADGQTIWIRTTTVFSGGLATTTFYTAPDSVLVPNSWSQLGTTASVAATGFFDSTAAVEIGTNSVGSAGAAGQVYYAELRGSIGGPAVAKFDASQAAHNATSWSSSTGETWTVNSTGATPAQIVGRQSVLFDGTSYCLKSAPFTLSQPCTFIVVGTMRSWSLSAVIFDGNTSDTIELVQANGTPKFREYAGLQGTDSSDWVLGTNAVVQAVYNTTASLTRVNRLPATSQSVGTNASGGFTLAAKGNGTVSFGNLQASRVFIFSTALDTSTLDKIALWAARLDAVPSV